MKKYLGVFLIAWPVVAILAVGVHAGGWMVIGVISIFALAIVSVGVGSFLFHQ